MVISNFWGGTMGLSSNQPGWATPAAGYLDIAPAALSSDKFLSWPRAEQVAYIEKYGTGTPKALDLGAPPNGMRVSIAATPTVRLQLPTTPGGPIAGKEFSVAGEGRNATAAELATAPSLLDVDAFLSWKREDQATYLTGKPQPVVIGGQPDKVKIFASAVPDVQAGAGVIQRTSGDDQPIPYHHLDGSASGSPSSIVAASAEALFPSLNGSTHTLPVGERPEFFNTSVAQLITAEQKKAFIDSFSEWHSAYQLEYIKSQTTDGTLVILDASNKAMLTAFVSQSNDKKLYILQNLDKNTIATLSKADQARIALLPGGGDLLTSLGLTASTTALTAQITALKNEISTKTTQNKTPAGPLPPEDRAPFLTQLSILQSQIDNSGLVAPADIQTKIQELKERYLRAFEFYDVKVPSAETRYMNNSNPKVNGFSDPITVYYDVITANGDISGINRGYLNFIAQEKRIAELATARQAIAANDGSLFGKKLDVPYLVYKLQSLYNLTLEAHVIMETEEINQQNDLLKTYAAFQDLVNRTLQTFAKADEGGKYVLGLGVDDYRKLTDEQHKLIGMFEDVLGAGQKHPIERLRAIPRPLSNVFNQTEDPKNDQNYDLVRMTHPQWSTIGTRLSETVTLINQNSQLKMNDINSLDKQRNRHFELANNALAKMNEILQSIGRA